MGNIALNNKLKAFYLNRLKNLDDASILDVISELSQSLKKERKERKRGVRYYSGAWKSTKTAEQINKEIRNSRTFTRTIENL